MKKTIAIAAIAAGALLMTTKKSSGTGGGTGSGTGGGTGGGGDHKDPNQGGQQGVYIPPPKGISGHGNCDMKGIRSYAREKGLKNRYEWAQIYKTYLETMPPKLALDKLRVQFFKADNPMSKKYLNVESLALDLALSNANKSVRLGSIQSNYGGQITWDSPPLYDTWDAWHNNLLYWDCGDWIAWHQALEAKFGRKEANEKWIVAWMDEKNQCDLFLICPDTTDCLDLCENFVGYLYKKGIDVQNMFSGLSCNLSNIVQDTGDAIQSSIKTLGTLLPMGLALVGGKLIYDQLKK